MSQILIAEDDFDQRDMLAALLGEEGYSVRAVDNGSDASQELKETPYDLAILDVRMPGKDGLTVLKEVQQENPAIPVIMMSAFASEADHKRFAANGATASLSKPYSVDALLRLVAGITKTRNG
jgi:CheY-like chemotaxis protein